MPQHIQDDRRLQLDAILAEYNALYRLAEYRLQALDRRIPAIGGLLTAFLGSVPVIPAESQLLVLVAIPASLVWLVRTTINHARSFEDALRAIEKHEHRINALLGHDLMRFQSGHPSKGQTVGGRTGTESVYAVLLAAGLLLLICLYIAIITEGSMIWFLGIYGIYIAGIAFRLACAINSWRGYRYLDRI